MTTIVELVATEIGAASTGVGFFFQSTSFLPIFYGRLVVSNKSSMNNYKTYITY